MENKFVRPDLLNLAPYQSARDEFNGATEQLIMLDANENNFASGLQRYPGSQQLALRNAMANDLACKPDNLIFGNGSDEIIDLIIRLTCEPFKDEMIVCQPTYGMYEVSAKINGVKFTNISLTNDFKLNTEQIKLSEAKLCWVCNPNNPTGTYITKEEIKTLLITFNGLVIVDEAYIDFCPEHSVASWVNEYDNLLVMQTFSKAKGLAGIRLGYAVANEDLINWLFRIKPPYNINQLTEEMALKYLRSGVWKKWVNEIIEQREQLKKSLSQIPGINIVGDSQANFILFGCPDANALYQQLLAAGIVVRNRSKQIANTLRVTVGTKKENDLFVESLKQLMA